MIPSPVVIEIVEKRKKPASDSPHNGIIVPNDVRLNGQSLMCSADDPVIVHEMSTASRDVVKVTLTLFASRVFVGHDEDDAALNSVDEAQRALREAQAELAESQRLAYSKVLDAQQTLVLAQRAASGTAVSRCYHFARSWSRI